MLTIKKPIHILRVDPNAANEAPSVRLKFVSTREVNALSAILSVLIIIKE